MKKRQVLKFNADELCQTHYKKQHAQTFKSKKGTSTKLQTKCNSFFAEKDSAKPTKPTTWLTITKHLTVVTAQKNAVGESVHLLNLHYTEFFLCKQVIFKTSTAKNSG